MMMQRCGAWSAFAIGLALLVLPVAPASAASRPVGQPLPSYVQLVDQAKAAMLVDPAKVVVLAQAAETAAARGLTGRDRALGIATAQWLQAEALFRSNEVGRAIPLIRSALQVVQAQKPQSKLRGDLLMTRARAEMSLSKVGDALRDFEAAVVLFRDLGEQRSEAIALQGIGSVYQDARDYAKVLRYYAQSEEVASGDPGLELSSMNNQATALRELGRTSEAEAAYQKALGAAQRVGSPLLEARVLGNLADLQLKIGRLDAATTSVDRGLALARSREAAGWQPILLGIAANLALQRNDVPRAVALVEAAWRQIGRDNASQAYRDLHIVSYQAFKRAGNGREALTHLEMVQNMSEQTSSVASSANAALTAARFDFANQNLRISRLKEGEAQRDLALARARQRQSLIILLAVVLLGGAATFFLAVYARSVRRSRNDIRAANDNLTEANASLEKALVAKTQFLATTSHEIRTPLNGILGMTQVMLADGNSTPDMRERIGLVHTAGETMRLLVDDLLDLAKMETGRVSLTSEVIDLRTAMGDAVRFWKDRAEAKGLKLALDVTNCPERVLGDAARLRQVVFNLLANAIKFTPEGSVRLRVATTGADDHARLVIHVVDTGIGIPADALEAIFEKFHQLDSSTTRQFGGTGLGLAICRNLVEAMDGHIHAESRLGTGSTFIVDLPLETPVPAAVRPTADGGGGILLTGASPIGRSVLRAMLEPHFGAMTLAEESGVVEDLQRLGPAVLLVDGSAFQALPDRGEGRLAGLARASHARGVPIALLWAGPDDAMLTILKGCGIDLVVAKPVMADALVGKLRELVANSGENRMDADLLTAA